MPDNKSTNEKPDNSIATLALARARSAQFPQKMEPMLAHQADVPFTRQGWIFEPKFDGIRALAFMQNGAAKLLSRRGLDITKQYPSLSVVLSEHTDDLVVDGEIVALDADGRPSFQLLQQRLNLSRHRDILQADANIPIVFWIFDALHCGGKDLRELRLVERKEILRQVVNTSYAVRIVEGFETDGETAFHACLEIGLEGLVGKRLDSIYESGRRSQQWLKLKGTLTQDFVICGYTEGTGSRSRTFGSLILGEYDEQGTLHYVGGAGSGFDDKGLDKLLAIFKPLIVPRCPFRQKPQGKLNPTWLEPELVAEIKFMHRTHDKILRSPVFLRLRDDIDPKDARHRPIIRGADVPITREPVLARTSSPGEKIVDKPNAVTDTAIADTAIADVLEQLQSEKEKLTLKVGNDEISLTNLDKIFWPATDTALPLTKRDYIVYLAKVSPYLLPHLKDRPLTLVRFPNGIAGSKFYQKHLDKGLPPFVSTVRLFTELVNTDKDFMVCNNLSTLLWLGQIADLELHTSHTRFNPHPDALNLPSNTTGSVENIESSFMNYPDYLIFDLDPYLYSGKESKGAEPELHKEGFKRTCEAAYWLKEMLDSLAAPAFVKTSGRTGLHIFVPIVRNLDYATVRGLTDVMGQQLVKAHPLQVTMEWLTVKRTGKVFLDHNMNARSKSLASIYSPRVAAEASVSTPLDWKNLNEVYPTEFTIRTVPERLARLGDLWRDILNSKCNLDKMLSKNNV